MINQYEPTYDATLSKDLVDYLSANGWITEFKQTQNFENSVKELCDRSYAVACSSGTTALEIAYRYVNQKTQKKKFIIPNFTMAGTGLAALVANYEVILCPVDWPDLTLSADALGSLIDSETAAVVYMPANGREGEIKEVRDLIKGYNKRHKQNVYMIVDGAQCLGACDKGGIPILKYGDISTLSFSMPKIITTGQGGMVLSDIPEVNDWIRKYKDFGRASAGTDKHDMLGTNYKFTDLQAVTGLNQLKNIQDRVARKKEIYKLYSERLRENIIGMYPWQTPWFVECLLPNKLNFKNSLLEQGISLREMYPPMNSQIVFQSNLKCVATEEIEKKGMWLPSHLNLTDEQIHRVCDAIQDIL